MKKIFVLLFGMLAASQVFAQTIKSVCPGTLFTAVNTNNFVVRDFAVRCSNNVIVRYVENSVAIVVGGVSTKGNNSFRGGTGGGAISGLPCATVTCAQSDADTDLVTILSTST